MNDTNLKPPYYSAPNQAVGGGAPVYNSPVYGQSMPAQGFSAQPQQMHSQTVGTPVLSAPSISSLDEFDNMLVTQIDAFREKALMLQSMINEKEAKARTLSDSVYRLQSENQKLSAELEKRKAEASGLVSDVQNQVNNAFNRIDQRLVAFEGSVGQRIDDSSTKTAADVKASLGSISGGADDIRAAVAEMKQAVGGISSTVNAAVENMNSTVGQKLDASSNQLVENVGSKLSEMDNKIGAKLDDKLGDGLGSISSTVSQAVSVLGGSFDTVVKQVADNNHSENVLLYRNIQDILRDKDTSQEDSEKLEKSFKGLKRMLLVTNVLLGVSLLGIFVILLRAFGIM